MGRKVGGDRGEGPPAILDAATRAVLIGERAVERLVIQQRVARPGRPAEAAAFDENLVSAALEVIGLVILGAIAEPTLVPTKISNITPRSRNAL